VAVRAVKQTLAKLGLFQHSAAHLEAVLALAQGEHPSGECCLPQGLRVQRRYDRLLFTRTGDGPLSPPEAMELSAPGTYRWGDWSLTLTPAVCPAAGAVGDNGWYFPDAFPLTLRPRRSGDRLRLPGRREKPLKKWFIDEKVPKACRDSLPVLTDARGGILAVGGLGPNGDRLAHAGERGFLLTVKEERKEEQL